LSSVIETTPPVLGFITTVAGAPVIETTAPVVGFTTAMTRGRSARRFEQLAAGDADGLS